MCQERNRFLKYLVSVILSHWQEFAGVLVPSWSDQGLEMELCVFPVTPAGKTKATLSPPTYTLSTSGVSLLPSPKAEKECTA